MIIELRKKSQITLPKEIVNALNLAEGDQLEVSIINGVISLEPVAIYPKNYLDKIEEEIKYLKESNSDQYKTYDDVDELIRNLKTKNK